MLQEYWQVYGLGGELVGEYKLTGGTPVLQKEYGYRGGQLLVVYDSTETGDKRWQWLVTDQLGTPRMIADLSGSLAGMKRHDYLPFGEELYAGTGIRSASTGYAAPDKVRQQFGAYERDIETGLDYFGARYLSSLQGRFTSVDPMLSSGDITKPQSWNRYSYSYNNPVNLIDINGLYVWGDGAGEEEKKAFRTALANLAEQQKKFKVGSSDYKRIGKVLWELPEKPQDIVVLGRG